jgi:hypothetical protein
MFLSHDVLPPHCHHALPCNTTCDVLPAHAMLYLAHTALHVSLSRRHAGSRVEHMGCRECPGCVEANLSTCLGAGRDVSATGGRDRRISHDTGRLPHSLVRPRSTPSLRIAAQRLPQRRLPCPLSLAWRRTGVISLLGHVRACRFTGHALS